MARSRMVAALASSGAVFSRTVLGAMERVPRHIFVSEALRYRAYEDCSLPIGFGQTISRPSTVARMLQALSLSGVERVLEIGAGSGYQTALLAEIAGEVHARERIDGLFSRARDLLLFRMRYGNVRLVHGEDLGDITGSFDAIVVAAGAPFMPESLLRALAPGGSLVIPIGNGTDHSIKRYLKKAGGRIIEDDLGDALFVPLVCGPS